MSFSQTLSGKILYYKNPEPESICIEDIARGLSNLCRYSGQVPKFYSVAEHCVLGLDHLPLTELTVLKAWFMHDATEAYISDVPGPLKLMLPALMKIEEGLAWVINAKYKIPYSDHIHVIINGHDKSMLRSEAIFMEKDISRWGKWLDSYPVIDGLKLQYWPPELAERQFLAAFEKLFGHGHPY